MDNATKEYSSEPLCVDLCVCVCVCVSVCVVCLFLQKKKRNPSKNMKLESIVVYENGQVRY